MRGDFTRKIKSLMEQPTPPPSDVWDNIENELDVNEVWTGLQAQLDIDQVWLKVDQEIEQTHQINWYNRISQYSSAAMIVLALSLAWFITFSPNGNLNQQSASIIPLNTLDEDFAGLNSNAPVLESPLTALDNTSTTNNASTVNPIVEFDQDEPLAESLENGQPIIQSSLANTDQQFSSGYLPMAPRQHQPERIALPISNDVAGKIIEINPLPNYRWYIGITGGVKNNWLINSKTVNNFKSSELNSTDLDFNYEYGILGGYHLNQKYAIQAELYFYSGEGQQYHEYIGGNYLATSIDLTYQKLELLAKRKFKPFRLNSPFSSNLLIGVQVGHLSRAMQTIGNETSTFDQPTTSFIAGLSGGYELTYALTNRLSATTAIRLRYGFTSVFKEIQTDVNFLNSSKAASLGANISLQYALK